jgi:hypothetical protein
MNRTGKVQRGIAMGRAPSRLTTRWFVSMVGVGLPLVVACATTINGSPADNGSTPAGDADPDAVVGTDDSSTTPMPDTGGNPMNDVGSPPTDGPLGSEGAPADDGAPASDSPSSMEGGSPMDNSAPTEAAPPVDGSQPVDSSQPVDTGTDIGQPVDSAARCPGALPLPYPVDGNGSTQPRFFPYGYDGDFCATQQTGTPGACPGHVVAGAVGQCWSVTVTPRASACTDGGVVKGWTGVRWQYPANNFSTVGGLNICAATTVTFWAKGAIGGETVSFYAGNNAALYQAKLLNQVLSNTWMQLTMAFAAPGPDSNVTQGFFWLANEPAVGGTLSFMIDDIQWQ